MKSQISDDVLAFVVPPSRKERRRIQKKQRMAWYLRFSIGFVLSFTLLMVIMLVVGFATPWGNKMRLLVAETVISSRHSYLAKFMTTPSEYNTLLKQVFSAPVYNTGVPSQVELTPISEKKSAVEIQALSQDGWTGFVMFVHDPRLIRLVSAQVVNGMGEYITHIGERTGAIAGTNASGFQDPKGEGWGNIPVGLEYVDGQVKHWPDGTGSWATIGFTNKGVMVMGNYTVTQLQTMGVRDAMQFHPELVVNGKPMITYGDGGWGYGPRTAIGQEKDGTVIFIVINGRFHGGSNMGASQKQMMDLMLKYGAINACAMDGGSSSVLYSDGKILNSPSTIDPSGQRHLPDAWMVFGTEQAANSVN